MAIQRRGRSVDFGPPAARALSQFVAVNATASPVSLPLSLSILVVLVAGLALWQREAAVATAFIGLALIFSRPAHRSGVIEQLDRARRSIGLDRALASEKIDVLEPAAMQWERIDNALHSRAWRAQPEWQPRAAQAAQVCMVRLIAATLKNRASDEGKRLAQLAIAIDRVSASMGAYERPDFDATGVLLSEGQPEVEELARVLKEIESLQ